ncbi:hypothetical protein IDM40_14990 [Nocardiopsis sp. HNM0947]|uniref:RDD family protein n=1 Tax=Nocardiopsis coralli TaxID=2772213 RepID=A0ABR9P865_9ACTN|nr:hypothetical protein [Nocardiopsis coralli]MBE3000004.1 hypothetical protein [Nocardiopsis coralli]
MERPFDTGAPAAVEAAVALVPLLVVLGGALHLRAQHVRYGPMSGMPGQLTLLALYAGAGLAAYAVWPLPTHTDGLCVRTADPAAPPVTGHGPLELVLAAAVLLPVGLLARYRFRRGLWTTLAIGTALALAAAAVRATGLLGVYPCAYAETSWLLVALGVLGTLLGWLIARFALGTGPGRLARGWPGAVPDRGIPALVRRLLGTVVDLGLWWFGTAAALALARLWTGWEPAPDTADAVLPAVAVAGAVLVPLLRLDRATPGGAALRLGLADARSSRPAARWRVLVRALLLPVPVALALVFAPIWLAPVLVVLHSSTAVVRDDRAGLADLVTGVRVTTRATLTGELPTRLVLHREPAPEPALADT